MGWPYFFSIDGKCRDRSCLSIKTPNYLRESVTSHPTIVNSWCCDYRVDNVKDAVASRNINCNWYDLVFMTV